MTMTVLDWDKPYGTIFGGSAWNAKYSQDGKVFDIYGNCVSAEDPIVVEEKAIIPNQKEIIEDMISSGMTHTQVGKKLGITRQKVTKIASSLSK